MNILTTVPLPEKLKSYIILFRVYQYYKNFLIFLGVIFSGNLFVLDYYILLILGFVSLCLISSANYIVNDLKDMKKDKLHPEKRFRPLASGKVSTLEAYILLIITFSGSISIGLFMPISSNKLKALFIGTVLLIFVTSQLYTYYFKQKAIYDVTFIALNYIWRAIAGVLIIDVYLSPWLFALGFLFALFLALAKRRGDIILLGEEAVKHRKVFVEYSLPILDQYISIIIGSIVVVWAIYIIEAPFRILGDTPVTTFTNENIALLSIPLVTISAFKLLMLLQFNSKYARKAEFIFLNREILILGFITGFVILLAIYWDLVDPYVQLIIPPLT